MKQQRLTYFRWIGLALCVIGVIGAAPTLYYQYTYKGSVQAQATSIKPTRPATSPAPTHIPVAGHPASITVTDAKIIDLPVIDGQYNQKTKTWTLSKDKAQYAAMTAPANDTSGLPFIYGHYRKEVFARLHTIKPGAVATVTTDNGYRFTYVFRETLTVAPDNSEILNYSDAPPVLLLQTCTGTWFENRQLFIFDFTKVEKL